MLTKNELSSVHVRTIELKTIRLPHHQIEQRKEKSKRKKNLYYQNKDEAANASDCIEVCIWLSDYQKLVRSLMKCVPGCVCVCLCALASVFLCVHVFFNQYSLCK